MKAFAITMINKYVAMIIIILLIAVMVVVSHMTNEPTYGKIQGLTYGTLTDEDRKASRASWNKWDVIGSLAVLGAIIAAYLYFTG